MPAYVPNPVAAFVGGGRPIDGGRNYRDGRRIFGDGKTWRGFGAGVAAGIIFGILQIQVYEAAGFSRIPELTIPVVCILAFGALFGDLVKSFFKRRLGKDRGAPWLIADHPLQIAQSGWQAAVSQSAVSMVSPSVSVSKVAV